ncbi:MAG: hypothetical protein ACK2T5_16995 [Anaerolineales bacterium]
MAKHTQTRAKGQGYRAYSAYLGDRVYQFLRSLLVELDANLGRRLVETFQELVMVLIIHRHRNQGLLLSELGGYLLPPAHAPASTKRISNLLRSPNWDCEMIEQFLWQQADRRVAELSDRGKTVLTIWGESILEKAQSLHLERLCTQRSTKAVRLKRIKPGYFNPPAGRPIFVPGYHWLQILVCGMPGPPNLAHRRFWTTQGGCQSSKRDEEREILAEVARPRAAIATHHHASRRTEQVGVPTLAVLGTKDNLMDNLGAVRLLASMCRGSRLLRSRPAI